MLSLPAEQVAVYGLLLVELGRHPWCHHHFYSDDVPVKKTLHQIRILVGLGSFVFKFTMMTRRRITSRRGTFISSYKLNLIIALFGFPTILFLVFCNRFSFSLSWVQCWVVHSSFSWKWCTSNHDAFQLKSWRSWSDNIF